MVWCPVLALSNITTKTLIKIKPNTPLRIIPSLTSKPDSLNCWIPFRNKQYTGEHNIRNAEEKQNLAMHIPAPTPCRGRQRSRGRWISSLSILPKIHDFSRLEKLRVSGYHTLAIRGEKPRPSSVPALETKTLSVIAHAHEDYVCMCTFCLAEYHNTIKVRYIS
jgi:hypothetical protein